MPKKVTTEELLLRAKKNRKGQRFIGETNKEVIAKRITEDLKRGLLGTGKDERGKIPRDVPKNKSDAHMSEEKIAGQMELSDFTGP